MAKKTPADKPSEENSHEDNVKISLEAIVGGKVKSRKVQKSPDDKNRDRFIMVINAMEKVESREFILTNDFDLDLGPYNADYSDAINGLLEMLYNIKQLNLIDFYLYDRLDGEGALIPINIAPGQDIVLQSASDLYDALKMIK